MIVSQILFLGSGYSICTGFLGQRVGPISSLAFHKVPTCNNFLFYIINNSPTVILCTTPQHKVLLAAGAKDSFISIFAGEKSY